MFKNSVTLEKDPEQVNFIKMRIQGIWDCLDQDQEVGAKHINETEMFQMTSRERMEPIDEEARDVVDLEDVSSPNILMILLSILTNPMRTIPIKELVLKSLVYRTYCWIECICKI